MRYFFVKIKNYFIPLYFFYICYKMTIKDNFFESIDHVNKTLCILSNVLAHSMEYAESYAR